MDRIRQKEKDKKAMKLFTLKSMLQKRFYGALP